jgi:hypothetical protein
VVIASQHCRGCGYELRTLPVTGRCPECGLAVLETIHHTTDPAASRLPKLKDPRRVGDGLVLVVASQALAAILIGVRPVTAWLGQILPTQFQRLSAWTPPGLELVAVAFCLSGLVGVWWLTPPREDARVRRHVLRLGLGIVAVAVLVTTAGFLSAAEGTRTYAGLWSAIERGQILPVILIAIALTYAAVGLRGVFRTIGLRSRAYRRARGGRQRVLDVIAAFWGGTLGLVVQDLAGDRSLVELIGRVIAGLSFLMLAVGMAYLFANAWWIRRALRRPPPSLESLVGMKAGEQGLEDSP